MRRLPSPLRSAPQASSHVVPFAAMAGPAWRIGTLLAGFSDVTRAVPIGGAAPSLWAAIARLPIGHVDLSGLAAVLAVGTLATLLAHIILSPPRRDRMLATALLAALSLPWVLPAATMVDFAPALLLAFADGHRRRSAGPIGWTSVGMLLAMFGLAEVGAIALGIAIWSVARVAIVLPANDNALPLQPLRSYFPQRAD